ncbi:hypothetical protein Tsac_2836 [Thermoanaerobacterium phage THSA-485A]|uniref:hypothetical protein n=1 Tax=Thermoanaerobacterium phage THSA-485A TaxID=1126885 RepID=UPI000263F82D|nr:hypothetical protein Tsac_2836 [Thermoanaerobacterium phage THSA-485A]AFK87689.1 hypothetical protein Tsac_2836 [Thermoanaerobacterium phage THSA-485A]
MKMKRIEIKENAEKVSPQRSFWGEENKREEILPAGTKLFHVSVMGKIKNFAPVVTCFSEEEPVLPGEIYMCIIKKDIKALKVVNNEWRIDLSEYKDDIEIYYIGKSTPSKYIKELWNGDRRIRWYRPRHYSLVSEYKELEKEWNKREEELTPAAIAAGWRIVEF